MDTQTESHTPIAQTISHTEYLRLLREQEDKLKGPSFTLKASDITAPLVIDFWVKVQQRMRGYLAQGFTVVQAEKAVRSYYFIQPYVAKDDVKLSSACAIAGEMEQWPARRLAD